MAQQLAGHAQQVADQAIADRVMGQRAVLARGDQVARAQRGQVLRHGGLIELQRLLELLHRALSRRQQLEDADTRRVAERAKEIGLDGLELRWLHYINIFEYIEDSVKAPATARPRRVRRWRRRAWRAASEFSPCH